MVVWIKLNVYIIEEELQKRKERISFLTGILQNSESEDKCEKRRIFRS